MGEEYWNMNKRRQDLQGTHLSLDLHSITRGGVR